MEEFAWQMSKASTSYASPVCFTMESLLGKEEAVKGVFKSFSIIALGLDLFHAIDLAFSALLLLVCDE